MSSMLALLSPRAAAFRIAGSASRRSTAIAFRTKSSSSRQQHPISRGGWQQQHQHLVQRLQQQQQRLQQQQYRSISSAFSTSAKNSSDDDENESPKQARRELTNRTAVRRLRVAELREELTIRGIDATGIREILLARLLEDIFGAPPTDGSSNASTRISKPTMPTMVQDDSSKPPITSGASTGSSTTQLDPNRIYVLRFRGHTNTSYSNAGVGLVLYDVESQKEVWAGRKYFWEEQSRFEAEYKGIAIGLKVALSKGVQRLVLQGDNHVILKQLEGSFNVKKEALQRLYWTAVDLKEQFVGQFEVQPINGAENSKAKSLASRAVATKKSHNLEGQDQWQQQTKKEVAADGEQVGADATESKQVQEDAPQAGAVATASATKPPKMVQQYVEETDEDEYEDADEDGEIFAIEDDGTETASPIDPRRRYLLRFDGGSRGNPGLAGAGMVIYDDNKQEVWCGWKYLEHRATNNDAEYTGLIVGLKCALSLGITNLRVEGDSELIVRQLEGRYKVKEGRLRDLYKECKELIPEFDSIKIRHIPRAINKRADELANAAMDSRESFGFEDTSE